MPKLAVLLALLVSVAPTAGWSSIGAAVDPQSIIPVDDRYTVQQDSTLMSGTKLVAVFDAGGPYVVPLRDMTSVDGTLFFWAFDMVNGSGLWKSDGTAAGTVLVKTINPSNLTSVNGTLFFTANDGTHGVELWKSDGTTPGTVMVKDINANLGGSFPFELTAVNGTLFFVVNTMDPALGVVGQELWKSDGQAEGTVLVKVLNAAGTCCLSPALFLTNVNGMLFLRVRTPGIGVSIGLWKSDGTAEGTVLVKAVNPGNGLTLDPGPNTLRDVNGTLFFSGADGDFFGNVDVWKSDGTEAGTVLVHDVSTTSLLRNPYDLTTVNGTLFYTICEPTNGVLRELWSTDGTAAGTALIKAFPNLGEFFLTNVNGRAFFTASDPGNGAGLWKSDGTAAGTALVKAISVSYGTDLSLTNVNGTLFFTNPAVGGGELWKSDGTAAGTVVVHGVVPGLDNSYPFNLTDVDDILFFTLSDIVSDVVQVRQLWASGTAATVLANDRGDGAATGTVSVVTRPSNGRLVLNADGTFTYRPDAGFVGTDTFTYAVGDRFETSTTATVTITVTRRGPDVLFRNGFE